MVPSVAILGYGAVQQGSAVQGAPCAKDNVRSRQGKGGDTGAEPLVGAAEHLHPCREDAEHDIEGGGGAGRHRGKARPCKIPQHLI